MTPLYLNSEAIVALIDRLGDGDEGFRISTTHYIAAHRLLARLTAEGVELDPPERLQRVLGPLLCSSPDEQERFRDIFDEWAGVWSARDSEPVPDPTPTPAEAASALARRRQQVAQQKQKVAVKRIWLGVATLGLAVTAVVGLVAAWTVLDGRGGSDKIGAIDPKQQEAVATEVDKKDDGSGEPSGADEKKAGRATPLVTPATVRPVVLIGLLLGCLAFLAVRIRLSTQIHEVLVRRNSALIPQVKRMLVRGARSGLIGVDAIGQIARRMRSWVEVPSRRLDVPRTVKQTVARGGRFVPVYGTRHERPHYVFLLQRRSFRDHATAFLERMVTSLSAEAVLVERFYYDGNPSVCFADAPDAEPVTLRQLAARFPDSWLVLFSDVENLVSLWTGELEPWVDDLQQWNETVVLTSEPQQEWGPRHALLQKRFPLLPASTSGLNELTQSPAQRRETAARDGDDRWPLPVELRTRPLLWTDRQPPDPLVVEQLLLHVHQYLGEGGYYWLSACAIFPAMHINLTLHLGERLRDAGGRTVGDETTFLRMAALPWFRVGYMPDWLRRRLVSDLPRRREQEARAVLDELLDEAALESAGENGQHAGNGKPVAKNGEGGFAIEVADESASSDQPRDTSLWKSVRSWWHRPSRLEENAKSEDYVFHTFMAGKQIDQLAVRLERTMGPKLAQVNPTTHYGPVEFERRMWIVRYAFAALAVAACLLPLIASPAIETISSDFPPPVRSYESYLHGTCQLVFVGITLAPIVLGFGWRRRELLVAGGLASAYYLLSWWAHVAVAGVGESIQWWFDDEGRTSTSLDFYSVWLLGTTFLIVIAYVLPWQWWRNEVDSATAVSLRITARGTLIAHWVLCGIVLALVTAFVTFVLLDVDQSSSFVLPALDWSFSLGLLLLCGFSVGEIGLGLTLRSTRLILSGAIFYWLPCAVMLAYFARTQLSDWSPILIITLYGVTVIVLIAWIPISIYAYIRMPDLTENFSRRATPIDASVNRYLREVTRRKKRMAIALTATAGAILVCVPLGIWGILEAPRWFELATSVLPLKAFGDDSNDGTSTDGNRSRPATQEMQGEEPTTGRPSDDVTSGAEPPNAADSPASNQPVPNDENANKRSQANNAGQSPPSGPDNRRRIASVMSDYPYRTICALQLQDAGDTAMMGTGFLIAPNIVMTAGHNLFTAKGGWARSLEVFVGRDGDDYIYSERITDVEGRCFVSGEWSKSQSELDDWGLILLDAPIGEKVGWLGLTSLSAQEIESSVFNLVGYHVSSQPPWTQWGEVGKVVDVRQRTLEYFMFSSAGQAGSPLFKSDPSSQDSGPAIVVGIHTYSLPGGRRRATRITPSIIDSIEQFKQSRGLGEAQQSGR